MAFTGERWYIYGMREPTKRQLEVLARINQHIAEHGYSPSLRELCVATGTTSTNGMSNHLHALERKKLIRRAVGVARGIVVLGNIAP